MARRKTSPRCPNCGASLDEAFIRQLAAPYIAEDTDELRQQIAEEERAQARAESTDKEVRLVAKIKALEDSGREITAQFRAEKAELAEALKESQAEEKNVRNEKRQLEADKDAWETKKSRELDQGRKEERKLAKAWAAEQMQTERAQRDARERDLATQLRERDNRIEALRKNYAAAERRAAVGPRQQEGIARQDVFADELRAKYPDDKIWVTRRGRRGTDVFQTVIVAGRDCGTIVFELKDQQQYSRRWETTLAADMKTHRAAIGVLVSTMLPGGVEHAAPIGERIVVCDFSTAPHLVWGLRNWVIEASQRARLNAGRQSKAAKLYEHVTSGNFVPNFQAIIDNVVRLRQHHAQFRTACARYFAAFDTIGNEQEDTVATIFGELDGMAIELPQIRAELPQPARRALPPGGSADAATSEGEALATRSKSRSTAPPGRKAVPRRAGVSASATSSSRAGQKLTSRR